MSRVRKSCNIAARLPSILRLKMRKSWISFFVFSPWHRLSKLISAHMAERKRAQFIASQKALRWDYLIGSSTSIVCKGMRVQKGKSLLCLHPFDVVVIVDCASYIFERCFDRNLCELWDIVALCA